MLVALIPLLNLMIALGIKESSHGSKVGGTANFNWGKHTKASPTYAKYAVEHRASQQLHNEILCEDQSGEPCRTLHW